MDQDLKEAVRGYRNNFSSSFSESCSTDEVLAKLDSIITNLESIRDSMNRGELNLEKHLDSLKSLLDEVVQYQPDDFELLRLVKNVVERTEIELLKILK